MSATPPIRLLLIDDDDLSREVLTLLLTDDGFAVIALDSGDAALDHLASAPDAAPLEAVLTDLQMPGLAGVALAQALRARLPAAILIAMSGSTPAPAMLAPFAAFLLKPFSPEDLRQALQRATSKTAAAPAKNPGDSVPETASPPLADAASPREPHAAVRGTPAAAVLDEPAFRDLAALMQPAQLHDLLALCLAEIDRYHRALQVAQDRNDTAALRAAAHALKGSVAMIGARELQALAAALEAPGLDPANQAATLREITPAADRLRRMLLSRGIELP